MAVIAVWAIVILVLGTFLGLEVYYHVKFTPEQRAQAESRDSHNDQTTVKRRSVTEWLGQERLLSRPSGPKPIVVKTLPRMTAPGVRRGLIEKMAADGYSMTSLTRTTTGNITFSLDR